MFGGELAKTYNWALIVFFKKVSLWT